jgi:hypothetical protein
MTAPSQQTFSGSPRAADDHGIHVTSHSGQVIRLPTPGTPRLPQFQHSLGSAICWLPLICFPPQLFPHDRDLRPGGNAYTWRSLGRWRLIHPCASRWARGGEPDADDGRGRQWTGGLGWARPVHGIMLTRLAAISVRPAGSQRRTVSAWVNAIRAARGKGSFTSLPGGPAHRLRRGSSGTSGGSGDVRSARLAGASRTGTRLRSGRMPSSPTGIAGHRRRAGL